MGLLDKLNLKRKVATEIATEQSNLDIAIDQLMVGCDITLDLGVVIYQKHRRISLASWTEWVSRIREIFLGLCIKLHAIPSVIGQAGMTVRTKQKWKLPRISMPKLQTKILWRPTRVHALVVLAACVVPMLFAKLPSPAVAFQREVLKLAKLDETAPATAIGGLPAAQKMAPAASSASAPAPTDIPFPAALRGNSTSSKSKPESTEPIKKIENLPPLPFSMVPPKPAGTKEIAVVSKGQAAPPSQASLPMDSTSTKQQPAMPAKQQPLLALDLSSRPEEDSKPDANQTTEKPKTEVKPAPKGLGIAKKEEPEMAPEPKEPMLVAYKGLAVTKDGFVISDPETRLPREIKVGGYISSTEKIVSVDPKSNTAKTNLRVLRVVE